MIFSSLRTAAFRNLADSEVNTNAKDVFLIGDNGQGKTNFLEALYFCSYASSFRTAHDSDLARDDEKNYCTEVTISESVNDNILVKFEKGKKSVFINGSRAEDRKELLSIAPCIVFCHEDMEFISGSPERRRWFFDQALSLYDAVYLDDLRHYRHILKSRNSVLRDINQCKLSGNSGAVLDALDPQYAEYGIKLMEKRETAAKEFSAVFGPLYEEVSGISGINVQYYPSWKNYVDTEQILDTLREKRAGDTAAGISLSGPHRDRYVFARNGIEFAGKASTGQRRLLALLLRTAQAKRFCERSGINPILLLDDVLLEMDGEKRRKFVSVLPDYAQAFYTFLPEEPYQRYLKDDTLVYQVIAGKLKDIKI
jgi:DNA replication and repair protein RecF